MFEDDRLRELIETALRQNFDLRIAAARIIEAQAQLGVTRADQFPTVDGLAEASRNRAARSVVPFPLDPYERSDLLIVTAAWESISGQHAGRRRPHAQPSSRPNGAAEQSRRVS